MDEFSAYKNHVLSRIEGSTVNREPFYHVYIEDILPEELYASLKGKALLFKRNRKLQQRRQDNADYVNSRYNLADRTDRDARLVHRLFSNPAIKTALLEKFYLDPDPMLLRSLKIHDDEFEFIYTARDRFQNIHIDIPAKFLSFVFYFPDEPLSEELQFRNSTILYDKQLKPHYSAKYKDNSVCIFAPHFYSYHGFSTTIERTVLVMFYINEKVQAEHRKNLERHDEDARLEAFKMNIQRKIEAFPLREYGPDRSTIVRERESCLTNAHLGRVLAH